MFSRVNYDLRKNMQCKKKYAKAIALSWSCRESKISYRDPRSFWRNYQSMKSTFFNLILFLSYTCYRKYCICEQNHFRNSFHDFQNKLFLNLKPFILDSVWSPNLTEYLWIVRVILYKFWLLLQALQLLFWNMHDRELWDKSVNDKIFRNYVYLLK